jgi:hypothetical protein
MQYLQETTDWGGSHVQNHIYYLTDNKRKMVGYIKAGTKKLFKFSKPMNFDPRGRKFTVLPLKAESDSVYFPASQEANTTGQVVEVQGSGGKKYFLRKNVNGWSCTCPGFMFRHKCKHVEEMTEK